MKKMVSLLVVSGLLLCFLGSSVGYSDCGMCPMRGQGSSGGYGRGHGMKGKYECPVTDEFMSAAHFYLENEKEIGLTEEQVESIKAMKFERKRVYIHQMADYQVFGMDLYQKLSEPKVDVSGTDTLIEQQAAAMVASAKETVAAYAKLKAVLTGEQQAKVKELLRAEKE